MKNKIRVRSKLFSSNLGWAYNMGHEQYAIYWDSGGISYSNKIHENPDYIIEKIK